MLQTFFRRNTKSLLILAAILIVCSVVLATVLILSSRGNAEPKCEHEVSVKCKYNCYFPKNIYRHLFCARKTRSKVQ